MARNRLPMAAPAMEITDPTDYHLDELARKSVLQHPQVVKRIELTKQRLRKAASMGLPTNGTDTGGAEMAAKKKPAKKHMPAGMMAMMKKKKAKGKGKKKMMEE